MLRDLDVRIPKPAAWYLLAAVLSIVHPSIAPSSSNLKAQVVEREAFDVVSIRKTQNGSMAPAVLRQEPSGLNATNVTTLDLIKFAFDVTERDIVGQLPGWLKTTKLDVAARTANAPLTRRRLILMVKALLEDRFRLDTSYDQARGPVFALVRERSDGRTGPDIRPSDSKCQVDTPLGPAEPLKTLVLTKCGVSYMTASGAMVGISGLRVTMQEVAKTLTRAGGFDRPVVDRTGLDGEFDLTAMVRADMIAPTTQARFLIALREQMGLTIRAEEGSFEVLRIRGIQQPSAN